MWISIHRNTYIQKELVREPFINWILSMFLSKCIHMSESSLEPKYKKVKSSWDHCLAKPRLLFLLYIQCNAGFPFRKCIILTFLSVWVMSSHEIWRNTWILFSCFTETYFCFLWNNCNHRMLLDECDLTNVPCLPFRPHLHVYGFGMKGTLEVVPGTSEISFLKYNV